MDRSIERDVRWLKLYAAGSSLGLAALLLAGFARQAQRTRFAVLDVERINIVEPSGQVRLVLSNARRMPDPVVNGKVFKSMRAGVPGMIFYNDDGDENGGLIFGNRGGGGGARIHAGLMFDQYKQDATVGLTYQEENGRRTAGLRVWDQPDAPITDRLDEMTSLWKLRDSSERERAIQALKARGLQWMSPRVFVGKERDRSAQVMLADPTGRPRLVLKVDSTGAAGVEFLDAAGQVVRRLTERAGQ